MWTFCKTRLNNAICSFSFTPHRLYQSHPLMARPSSRPSKNLMRDNWRKSVLFKDYGENIYDAFREPIDTIAKRNKWLIVKVSRAKQVQYFAGDTGKLRITLSHDQKWSSIDGRENHDPYQGKLQHTRVTWKAA